MQEAIENLKQATELNKKFEKSLLDLNEIRENEKEKYEAEIKELRR